MFLAGSNCISYSLHTERIRFGTLEEAAVSPYGIAHSVLSCPMEFYETLNTHRIVGETIRTYLLKRRLLDYLPWTDL